MSAIIIRLFLLAVSLYGAILSAQPVPLPFKPLDVQYSKSLDRLIVVATNPNSLYIISVSPGGGYFSANGVNLNLPPLSLSVSPDGTHAAVGHDGWISYVNLSQAYVEKNLQVTVTANKLVLTDSGIIWAAPNATINAATGVQTTTTGIWNTPAAKPALHPNGNWIYYTRGGSPGDVIKGDVSSGTFQYLYDSRYHGDFPMCGGIFYGAGGDRLLTGCGTLFRTAALQADDIIYSGALSAAPLVAAAADSSIARKFAVIPAVSYGTTPATDTELQFYDNEYLTLLGRVELPRYSSGSNPIPWRGRYVFYNPDATKLYLVLQADARANLTNDYAVYFLTLSTGAGCNPSLGSTSGNVTASGGSLDVSVTATAGCLWQASTTSTWLSVALGGVSSGSGTVSIVANPNLQTASRTGTVTIAGLTFTVTQQAASQSSANPVTPSPVRPAAADYSRALDRMILVSSNPNVLTILDPVTGDNRAVALAMPPTALSISPDGRYAAVGHDGRISYVNLTSANVERIFPVSTTVFDLALSAADIFAFPLRDQWSEIRVIKIATGVETLWNNIDAGATAGKISPNGKYLYINATKRYDVTQPLPAYDTISGNNPRQWFSQDGSRLFSGSGQAFRLSELAAQDLQYNGTLDSSGLAAVADSSAQQVTATVSKSATTDTSIKFFGQQYLAAIGSITIPKFTSGTRSFDAHGRYLFWNAAGNLLFAVVQADQTSGVLNDYAIYTVSWNAGCNTSLPTAGSTPAAGGTFTAQVTAAAGCAWKATSSAPWLAISENAFSAGPATLRYIVDPNPTTSARTATITVDGQTLTVTQAAGAQVQLSAVANLPFRVVDAEYSNALDRIVAISGSPSRLNIYNPATGANTPVTLPLAGNAVSVAPNGLRAAVCHDGLVSIVNLQTATILKSLAVTVNCYDVVMPDNGYVYMSAAGGWGTSSSVNISTGGETKADLLYRGVNFRLNPTGDAIYTSNTGTSSNAVARFHIAGGPMALDYETNSYPEHPVGYKLWFTADGRIVGDSGRVFRTGSTLDTDFQYAGTLSGYASTPSVGSAAHSISRHLFASVGRAGSYPPGTDTDVALSLHGDKYLALSSRITLPKITTGGAQATSHGKFVFWDKAGTKAYVLMQADASVGFLNDFAVYTLSPEFTAGCPVTLPVTYAAATAFAQTGAISLTAAADCIWEVTPSASWIQIDSGSLGAGAGNVGYALLANNTGVSRTGTINIGGQTFTIAQSGVAVLRGHLYATPTALRFGAIGQNVITGPQTLAFSFQDTLNANWTAASNQPNITVSPSSGFGPAIIQVTAQNGASGAVTISSPGFDSLTIPVTIASASAQPPIGAFETPLENAATYGAIAVTGWALDTVDVTKVEIHRERTAAEGGPSGSLVYIGDAIFVAGTRPDVAAAYPTYPLSYRGGWGYHLLTNFLPNSSGAAGHGNGTYKLWAIAYDREGNTTRFGPRTITVNNAGATKPFGTIDSPAQGGTASGTSYRNSGWVLTPQPCAMPLDLRGTTVYVDGQEFRNALSYNINRQDVATLFPGYRNSNGSYAYFEFDTTRFANGIHTIAWSAVDECGRSDGLGSRFFFVQNSAAPDPAAPKASNARAASIFGWRRGFDSSAPLEPLMPAENGDYAIEIEELDRIEIHGVESMDELHAGASLADGVFYWLLGPGYLNEQRLELQLPGGRSVTVKVLVRPRSYPE